MDSSLNFNTVQVSIIKTQVAIVTITQGNEHSLRSTCALHVDSIIK